MRFWGKSKKQSDREDKQPVSESPASTLRNSGLRYCSVEFSSFHAGDQMQIIYPRTGIARLLPSQTADLLTRCRTFRTLEEHADECQRSLTTVPGQSDQVWKEYLVEQLEELAQAGLLVSDQEFFKSLMTPERPAGTDEKIATVGIVTRNRRDSLKRCLSSFISNSRNSGRANDFAVLDDSESPEARNKTREMLRTLSHESGVSISYAGLEEKRRFAEALITSTELPPEVVEFALFDPEQCGCSIGANRNALLLHTVGDLFFSADDDTVCRITAHPETGDELALGSADEFLDYRFHPDHDSALGSVTFAEQDVLTVHEQLLGKEVKECVTSSGGVSRLNIDHPGSQFVQGMQSDGGRVMVTLTGLLGDAGISSPVPYLMLRPELRARVVQSESVYRSACVSREITRLVNCPVITDKLWGFQTTTIGFDNRVLLPPFLPVQRGQDGLFGITLRECFRNGYVGHLPWAVLHAPLETRVFSPENLKSHATTLPTIGIFMACITAGLSSLPKRAGAAERMRALGKYLMQMGDLPLPEFEEVVRINVWQLQGALASVIESQLRYYGETPDFWADDVRNYLDDLREALVREDYIVPHDLLEGRSPGEARQLSQRLVLKFGQLLYWWPEIVEATRALRVKGERLAVIV